MESVPCLSFRERTQKYIIERNLVAQTLKRQKILEKLHKKQEKVHKVINNYPYKLLPDN